MGSARSKSFDVLADLRDQLARLAGDQRTKRYTETLETKLRALTPEQRFEFNRDFIVPVAVKHGVDHQVDHVSSVELMAQLGAIEALPERTWADGVTVDYIVRLLTHVWRLERMTSEAWRLEAHLIALLRGEVEVAVRPFYPLPGGQLLAYVSDADVIGFGGVAGASKSRCAIGKCLTQHQRSIIFRSSLGELNALRDEIFEILGTKDGMNQNEQTLRPPALPHVLIEFGSVNEPGAELRYAGRPHDLLCIEELATFPEHAARFLPAWLRTTDPQQKCTLFATTNPPLNAEGRYIIPMFGAWLDREYATPAMSGDVRYYATVDGQDVERPGPEPFEHDGKTIKPQSRTFVFGSLRENTFLSASGEYEARLQQLPDVARAALLEGDFYAGMSEDPTQVVPTAWIEAAMARWRPNSSYPMDSIGVDVARGGKDRTVIARRHGSWFDRPLMYAGTETPDGPKTAAVIVAAAREEAPIHIDAIGVGASPFDFLNASGIHVVGVNVGSRPTRRDKSGLLEFANLRAQLWWMMREALDPNSNRALALPNDPELLRDLSAPRFQIRGAKIYVESRDEIIRRIGRSPDYATAYVLALMDTPKLPYEPRAQQAAQHDPYASMAPARDPYAALDR